MLGSNHNTDQMQPSAGSALQSSRRHSVTAATR